jgi:hypothetical protein
MQRPDASPFIEDSGHEAKVDIELQAIASMFP